MLGTPVEAPTNKFIDAAAEMYPEVKLWSLIAFARGRINLFQDFVCPVQSPAVDD